MEPIGWGIIGGILGEAMKHIQFRPKALTTVTINAETLRAWRESPKKLSIGVGVSLLVAVLAAFIMIQVYVATGAVFNVGLAIQIGASSGIALSVLLGQLLRTPP